MEFKHDNFQSTENKTIGCEDVGQKTIVTVWQSYQNLQKQLKNIVDWKLELKDLISFELEYKKVEVLPWTEHSI